MSCIFKYFANAFTLFCYFVRVLRYIIVPFLAIVVEILHFCNFERPVGFNLTFNLQGPPSAYFLKTSTLRIRCYVWKTFYISQIFTTYLLFTYYGYLKFATFTQVFQKLVFLKTKFLSNELQMFYLRVKSGWNVIFLFFPALILTVFF